MRRSLPLLSALFIAAIGCGGAGQGLMRERVGGTLRTRAFASPSAYEAYLRAELAMARGDPTAASAQMELAVTADPSDGFLAARRAEVLLARNSPADALRAAEQATQHHPDSAAAWIALAEVHRGRGDVPGVAAALQRAAVIAPDDPDVRAALSELQGGTAAQVARARRDAPDARDGDRNVARRALLDPRGDGRRWSLTRRRLLAAEHRARGDWAAVDRVLTPTTALPTAGFAEREAVIEARARDGRPREARAMLSALTNATEAPAARLARAWWLAGDAAQAVEVGCARELAEDPMALRVCAQALGAQGDVSGALTALSRVPVDAPWQWAGELAHDAWEVLGRELIDAAGRDVSDRHRSYASARILAARLIARGGDVGLASEVLSRALGALRDAADAAASRDALRIARATLRPEFIAQLSELETVWARHRRALLRPASEREAALTDLAARSGDDYEDAHADAWRALLCEGARCEVTELRAALARARRDAPNSVVVVRAWARWRQNEPLGR